MINVATIGFFFPLLYTSKNPTIFSFPASANVIRSEELQVLSDTPRSFKCPVPVTPSLPAFSPYNELKQLWREYLTWCSLFSEVASHEIPQIQIGAMFWHQLRARRSSMSSPAEEFRSTFIASGLVAPDCRSPHMALPHWISYFCLKSQW